MTDSQRTLGRRAALRVGVGLAATAAVTQSASAQDDPYDGWFDETSNYEGTVDRTGEETVTVSVGAGDNGLLFEPPAIQVDPGTTVLWEWTGEGGGHNVSEEDSTFESETMDAEGDNFEHTFEDAEGEIFRYVCTPHEALGMVGAVAVGDVVETIQDEGSEESTEDDAGGDGDDSDTGGSSLGPLSSEGVLAVFGGVIGAALLSPLIFALLLKFVYEDDSSTQHTDEHRSK